MLASLTQAADETWDGDTDGVWATLTNWVSGTGVPGTGFTATFNSAGGTVDIIDLGAGVTLNTLLFDTASVAAYTIGAGAVGSQTLTLDDNGTISLTSTVAANQLINANLSIDNATFTNADADNSLTIAGAISGASTGNKTLTVNGGGAGGITIDGIVSDGSSTSLAILMATANTTLTLNGNNTFTGGISGTTNDTNVIVGHNNALGTGTIKMEGLRLSANTGSIVLANAVSVGPASGGWRGGGSFDYEVSGLTTVDQDRQFNNGGNAVITLSGGITQTTGRPEFVAGSWDVTGVLAAPGSGGFGIRVNGSSANVTLSNANTFTGDADIQSGVLVANHNAALNAADIFLNNSGATFEVADTITINNALIVSDTGNNKILRVTAGSGTFAGTIDVQELTARNFDLDAALDTTLNITGVVSGVGSVDTINDGTIVFNGTAANTFAGDFTLGDGGSSTWDGTNGTKHGFVVVHRDDSLGTGTIISLGSQLQAGTTGINIANNINVDSGGLNFGGSESFEISGIVASVGGDRGIRHYGLDGVTITLSGGLDLDDAGTPRQASFEGTNGADNGDFLISGDITGGGTLAISSTFDNGVVTLTGDNSLHTGDITIAAGTLLLGATNVIQGATETTTLSSGVLQLGVDDAIGNDSIITQTGGTFELDGHSDTIHSYAGTGGTVNFGGTSELTVLNDSTFSNITVGVSGTLRTATGTTTTVNGASALGDPDSLNFDTQGTSHVTVSGSINSGDGNGEVNKTGAGTLRLTGDGSNWSGGSRIENGVLEFTTISNRGVGSNSSLGNAETDDILRIGSDATAATLRMTGTNVKNTTDRAVQLGDMGGTIDIDDASQTLTISGVVSDHNTSGSLTKAGAGTLVLGGANTFSGDTRITTGTLEVTNALGLQNSTLNLDGGDTGTFVVDTTLTAITLGGLSGSRNLALANESAVAITLSLGNNNADTTYSGVLSGAVSALTKIGTGTTTLTGTNTYDGGTTVTAGTLALGHATDTLLDTGAVNVNGGTLDIGTNTDTVGAITLTSGNIAGTSGVLTGASYDLQSGTVSAILGGAVALTKTTAGTVTLSGVNTYTGATTVSAGTLNVTGTLDSAVTVADGATLSGEGSTNGLLTLGDGTGAMGPGDGAIITVDTGTEPGAFTSVDLTSNIMGGTHVVNFTGTSAVGDITILTYGIGAGTFMGNTTDFTVGTGLTTGGHAGAGTFNNIAGTAITLTTGFADNTWTGTTDTVWEIGGAKVNWDNTLDTVWQDGDNAIFEDDGAPVVSNFTPTLGTNISANNVTFTNTANAFTVGASAAEILTVNGTLTANNTAAVTISAGLTGGASGLQIDGTGDLTISGVISGSNGLTKNGTGTTTLTTAPTYTGTTTTSAGTLEFEDAAIATATSFTHSITTGATVEYDTAGSNRSDPTSLHINGGGTFKKSGGGQLSLVSGGSVWDLDSGGLVHVTGGVFNFGGATPGIWTSNMGDMEIDGGATFEGRSTEIFINALDGAGILGIGGKASTGTGVALTIGAAGGGGTFSGVIKNTTDYGTGYVGAPFNIEKINGGTQILSGNNTYTGTTTISGGTLQIGDGGANGSLGTGNTINNAALIFNTSGDHTYAGAISGTGTLDHNGAGTTTLSGNNDYTGVTSVNAGTLEIGGTNTSTIDVGTGAGSGANLGGEGSTSGTLTFKETTHSLNIDASTAAALGTTGSGVLDISALSVGGFTVNSTGTGIGAVTVLNYGGVFTGALDRFAVGTGASGHGTGSFTNTGSAITIDLGFVDNTWTGATSVWDIGSTANWSNAKDSVWQDGDNAIFQDTGVTNFAPTLASNIIANNVTFTNTVNTYNVFTGGGSNTLTINGTLDASNTVDVNLFGINGGTNGLVITGAGDLAIGAMGAANTNGLTKNGSGTTTLTGAQAYTGTTTVNEGTLKFVNGAMSTVQNRSYGPIAAGATLEFNVTTGSQGVGKFIPISGGGTFKKTGAGTLSQTSADTIIAMDPGALFHIAEGIYIFGAGGIGFYTDNKSDLQVDETAKYQGSATPARFDALSGGGIIQFGGGLTLGVDNSTGSNVFTGIFQDDAMAYTNNSLTKVGTGTQILDGNNTYTGATTVSGGTLVIGGTNTSAITVASGAQLDGEGTTTGALVFSGTTHTINADLGTAAALGSTTSTDVNLLTDAMFFVNISGSGSGAVDVLTHGGSFTGTLAKFAKGTGTVSTRAGSGVFSDSGTAIQYDAGFADKIWYATTDQNWDEGITGTDNWSAGGGDNKFYDGDNVTFTNSDVDALAPATDQTVTLTTSVAPGSIAFTNNTNTYTINESNPGVSSETITTTGGVTISGTANVTINAAIGGTGGVTNSGAGNATINSAIDGTGGLTQSGTGITTLSGTNTYTGDTTISSGTLTFGANNVIGDTSVINLSGATGDADPAKAVINANGKTEILHSVNQTGGVFELRGADLTLLNDSTFNNIQTFSGAAVLRITDGTTLTATGSISQLATSLTFDVQGTAEANVSAAINTGGGDGSVDKTGTGTLRLTSNDSAWGGGTRINEGTVEFTSITNVGSVDPDNDSSLGNADRVTGGDTLQIGSSGMTGTAATLRMTGTHTKNSSDRAVQLGDAGGTIDVFEAAQTLTLSGVLANDTANSGTSGALTKAGAGTLVLGGANTYSGNTTVAAGTLRAGSTTAFGSATTSAMTVNAGATLQLDGNDNAIASLSGAGTVENANAIPTAATLTTGGDNTDTTFSGVIQDGTGGGALALTKLGTGTQTLTGTNTYTGATNITDGTLLIDGSTGAGSSVNVLSGGTLGGSGTINGATTIQSGGNHTAGTIGTNTAATQILTSTLTYDAGATVTWDLISNSTGSGQFDQFNLTTGGDLLAFGGNLNFDIDFGSSVNFEDNFWNSQLNEWKVWDTGVVDAAPGTFTITNSANPSFNGAFILRSGNQYGATDTTGIWLVQTSVIPEPSTYAIFGLGLALFGWTARRRRKQASAVVSD